MARNKVYTAHVRGRGGVDADIVFVKDGFSWPAFFFTAVWALWHRLWLFALIVLGQNLVQAEHRFFLKHQHLTPSPA